MPISARHLMTVLPLEERHVTVETPDHEVIDFEGCSADEVEAKLHDFEAWAS